MASTYTLNQGIEKPGTGEQSGTWGNTTNTNFDIIDRALSGVGALSLTGTTTTLTTTDGSLTDGMYKVLVLGGSPSGTNTITIGDNTQDKLYFVVNSSGQEVIFTQGTGANATIANGAADIIYADGAGSGAAVASFFGTALKIGTDVTVGDDLTLSSDSAVLGFGADTDTTLTHTDGTGLTLNSTNKLTFGDAASFIQQSGDGVLQIDGEATINMNASTALTVTTDTATFSSANANDPVVIIKNTTNDTAAGRLHFVKDKGAAGADGDDIGTIEFISDDSGQAQTSFAKIVAEVSESANTDEAGKLSFFVAESDGTTTALTAGLILEGEHATDGQVDVTIGAGAASTTTIAGVLDVGGREIILDADADSSITADTDDQIDIKLGGTDRMSLTTGNLSFTGTGSSANIKAISTNSSGEASLQVTGETSGGTARTSIFKYDNSDKLRIGTASAIPMQFETSDAVRMTIASGGGVDIPQTLTVDGDTNFGVFKFETGVQATLFYTTNSFATQRDASIPQSVNTQGGAFLCAVDSGAPFFINRGRSDGTIADLRRSGTTQGSISISGTTTSYNAFTGSHWSRLTDNSKPTILRGTVMETIDEMCDWYDLEFTIPAHDDEVAQDMHVSYEKPANVNVGDTVKYTHEGVEYDATVALEADIKHVKSKISDTADCTNVYGVFMDWDNDDDTVNDMYVNAVGTAVVRIHKDQTVVKGDLLTSNGDGTAKKQDDDIIRSKTIGKVLTNIKQETYSDSSYIVPCALYCG